MLKRGAAGGRGEFYVAEKGRGLAEGTGAVSLFSLFESEGRLETVILGLF